MAKVATVDPATILAEIDPNALPAAAPPGIANYRPADLQGIACAFCTKFTGTSSRDENGVLIPTGYCDQWEASVDGVWVCDRFTSGLPTFDAAGNEVWDFSDATDEISEYHEIHFAGAKVEERDGKLLKGILRTGHWDVTPTPQGKLAKPLTITRDGKSDPGKGIISLSEIVENFKSKKPIKRVQMPLSFKKNDDHIKDGNLTAANTGFVDDIWIVDDDNGGSQLIAACDIRKPDVREGVLQGTIEDVSSGIPFHPVYGAFLEHVCHTNTPFVDGLRGWITASDDAPGVMENVEIIHHVLPTEEEIEVEGDETGDTSVDGDKPEEEGDKKNLTFKEILNVTQTALHSLPGINTTYTVEDADSDHIVVYNQTSNTTWTVPYTIQTGGVYSVAGFEDWAIVEGEGEKEPEAETPSIPSIDLPPTGDADFDAARSTREMRLAASDTNSTTGKENGVTTVLTTEGLDRLELSDEARAAVQTLLDDNAKLSATNRETEVDSRIEELKGWGFSDRPGFLKLYRQIALSDDGGPAAILLSDDGSDTKERVTSRTILDRAIDALVGSEQKITFSDQHVESGNDEKPPVTDGEKRPLQERVAEAKSFLHR